MSAAVSDWLAEAASAELMRMVPASGGSCVVFAAPADLQMLMCMLAHPVISDVE